MACPATDVAVADAATKGATDAGVAAGTAADVGTGVAAADVAGGTAGALTATDAAAGTAGALTAADAAAGTGAAATGAGAIPEITVTAPAIAAGAGGGAGPALDAGLTGIAAGTAAAGGGGGMPAAAQGTSDVGSFLPATSDASSTPLSQSMMDSLGISQPTGGASTPIGAPDTLAGDATDSSGNDFLKWLENPRNASTLGLLGISGVNALRQPKLPSAATTALNAAGPAVKNAEAVIQSGGTATPIWQTQKASIDASITKGMNDAVAAYEQTAANAGMEGGVVQQQVSQIKAEWEKNRQEAYRQAQQQNVSNAVAELTGSDAVLTNIAQMQLGQSEQARALASNTAELALLLSSGATIPSGVVGHG